MQDIPTVCLTKRQTPVITDMLLTWFGESAYLEWAEPKRQFLKRRPYPGCDFRQSQHENDWASNRKKTKLHSQDSVVLLFRCNPYTRGEAGNARLLRSANMVILLFIPQICWPLCLRHLGASSDWLPQKKKKPWERGSTLCNRPPVCLTDRANFGPWREAVRRRKQLVCSGKRVEWEARSLYLELLSGCVLDIRGKWGSKK